LPQQAVYPELYWHPKQTSAPTSSPTFSPTLSGMAVAQILNQQGSEPQLHVNPRTEIILEADGCPAACGQCLDNPSWIASVECSSSMMAFEWEIVCKYCDEGKQNEVGKVWHITNDAKRVIIPAYTLVVCQQYDVTLTGTDSSCANNIENCPQHRLTVRKYI
jgi:hypothetical protein